MESRSTHIGKKDIRHVLDISHLKGRTRLFTHKAGGQTWTIQFNPRAQRKNRRQVLFLNSERQYSHVRKNWFTVEWTNLSWWVAFLFTVGSMVWLVNGCFCMWPLTNAALQSQLVSWSAFAGGLTFIIAGYAAMLEVFNQSYKVTIETASESTDEAPVYHAIPHRRLKRLRWMRLKPREWAWWMNTVQMLGALIFFLACVSGVFSLYFNVPMIALFWIPQMIGAVCFIIASTMAMFEVQTTWKHPNVHDIGWYAGLFNLIGAVGFLLCAWFGASTQGHTDIYWGSDFSTFWGSIGFLMSSCLMWHEAINP